MGRTKQFDHAVALEKAMHVFWQHGYDNTSLQDLLSRMGILNGSFYNTYGSKKNLFLKALAAYETSFFEKSSQLFHSPLSVAQKFQRFFYYAIERQKIPELPKGCFMFSCANSSGMADSTISTFVRSSLRRLEQDISGVLKFGQEKGELSPTLDPELLATVMVSYMNGLMSMCTVAFEEVRCKQQVDLFLQSMGVMATEVAERRA